MSLLEKLVVALLGLEVAGFVVGWLNALAVKQALDLSARALAVRLADNTAGMHQRLEEIHRMVDGRLDLALDTVTRLEAALARERGVEPPPPNPLALSTVPPAEE